MQSLRATRPSFAARPSRQPVVTTRALFDILKGMGNKASSPSKGWAPSAPGAQGQKVSQLGFDVTPLTDEQRKAAAEPLPKMSQYVCMDHGTERAFTGTTANGYKWDEKQKGTYVCAVGDLPLFSSDTKFNSGTGWPSFYAPIDKDHIVEVLDTSIPYMPRVEVVCARSGAHLGHVFDDGPRPTGKRYCINAAALKFIPEGQELPGQSKPSEGSN